jgi:hypothetical protein
MAKSFSYPDNWDDERRKLFDKESYERWKPIRELREENEKIRLNKQQFSSTTNTLPTPPFEEVVKAIALEAADILIKKHQDYGPDNINNAPGGPMNGLLVRMHDKMERLKTLIIGNKTPKYESIEDTLIDTLNYSIIALMIQREKWPKK